MCTARYTPEWALLRECNALRQEEIIEEIEIILLNTASQDHHPW
jgi:hypothetical protein